MNTVYRVATSITDGIFVIVINIIDVIYFVNVAKVVDVVDVVNVIEIVDVINGHPKCHFRYPQKCPKWVILDVFGYFGGTENGTSVA